MPYACVSANEQRPFPLILRYRRIERENHAAYAIRYLRLATERLIFALIQASNKWEKPLSFYAICFSAPIAPNYTGHTDELEARMSSHHQGTFKGYTSRPGKRPLKLVWHDTFATRDEAFAAERRIKGWSRAKKEALTRGDWDEIESLSRE